MRFFAFSLVCIISPSWLAAAALPAQMLDLSHWKLTVPVANPKSGRTEDIVQPQLATFEDRNYFWVEPRAKAVVFRAPCGGATTKGSKYPRSELREMSASDARTLADWSTADSELHALTVVEAVTHLPERKPHVCCAQIHDSKSDLIEVRVERNKLFVQCDAANDAELDPNYQLGTFFELRIVAGRGRVQVFYNGQPKMDWEVARKGCYFKAGCYTQSNVQKGDDAAAYGEVMIKKLSVTTGR